MPGVKLELEPLEKEGPIGETHFDHTRTPVPTTVRPILTQDISQPATTVPGADPSSQTQQYLGQVTTGNSGRESSVRPSQLPSEHVAGAHTYRVFVVALHSVLHIQVIDSLGRSTYLTLEG